MTRASWSLDRPAAVSVNDLVDFVHDANGLLDGYNDPLVVRDVVLGQCAAGLQGWRSTISHHHVIKELGCRMDARDEQVVAGTGASDV